MGSKKVMPVTIITGFLGSGKTSLLNEILQKNGNIRFLVIENEAGNINIDSELINHDTNNKVYELTSGCICCSLNRELGTLLNSIILSDVNYDYLLIEATGMADPGQIINMFTGPRIQRFFRLDGVVCVVDSDSFIRRVSDFHEAYMQISLANMVLINKSDLVNEDKLIDIEHRVKTINPFAEVNKTVYGRLEETHIVNRGLFQPSSSEKEILDFRIRPMVKPTNRNVHQIQTLSYQIPGSMDMEKLSKWFEEYMALNGTKILRIKGILSIQEMKHKIIIQSVGRDYHISQGSLWAQGQNRESKIVFIGSRLKKTAIKEGLYTLLVEEQNQELK